MNDERGSGCDDELEVLRAERAIGRVILGYARGIDRLDFDQVRSCFHPDATLAYDDWFSGDLDAAIAFLGTSLPHLDGTLHVFGTPWIELDLAADVARCETYSVNSARYPPLPPAPMDEAGGGSGRPATPERGVAIQNVTGARYVDRFELRDGRWAIVERCHRRVWTHDLPVSPDPPRPSVRDSSTPNGSGPT